MRKIVQHYDKYLACFKLVLRCLLTNYIPKVKYFSTKDLEVKQIYKEKRNRKLPQTSSKTKMRRITKTYRRINFSLLFENPYCPSRDET